MPGGASDEVEAAAAEDQPRDPAETDADEAAAQPRRRKRAARASVPSWDEIMLGRRAEK
jgi:hypothetical protein